MIIENTPKIETERLLLRRFTLSDIDDMFELYADVEVNRFLPWFPMETKEAVEAYFRDKIEPYYQNSVGYNYAIELKDQKRVVGYVCVSNIGESNDVGYAVAKQYWRKGIATEAAEAVLAQMCKAGFSFATATHDVCNPHSGSVMEKIKMTYRYSYHEQVQPKNIAVVFRMYQIDFQSNIGTYAGYRHKYESFEENIGHTFFQ